MGKLTIEAGRQRLYVGAGVNKTEFEISRMAEEEMVAAQVVGTYTWGEEWLGNSQGGKRRVFYRDKAGNVYNSINFENPGHLTATTFLPAVIRLAHDHGQRIVISTVALNHQKPLKVLPNLAEWALEMGADAVEIDGSCRNGDPNSELICENVERSYEITNAVRQAVGAEAVLSFKVSALPMATIQRYNSEAQLAVDCIDAINSLSNQPSPIDPATGRATIEVNSGLAGKSGPGICNLARWNLVNWRGFYESEDLNVRYSPYDTWSIGGVSSGDEIYYREQEMKADMVGVAQLLYDAPNPRRVIGRLIDEYLAAAS